MMHDLVLCRPALRPEQYVSEMQWLSDMCCDWRHDDLFGDDDGIADRYLYAMAYGERLRENPAWADSPDWVRRYHGLREWYGRSPV